MSEVIAYSVRLAVVILMLTCDSCDLKPRNEEAFTECGGLTNATRGIIQTPGFPKRFPVPIRCRWVIDASAHPDRNIVVYLTQLYVTTGLKFTDYVYYENEGGLKYSSENVGHIVTPENVTSSPWIRSFAPYLMIEFQLDRLEGNHLRFLDDKHNVYFVYGFNVTFELIGRESAIRNSCNARICSLLGECYASADYTSYECACFQGFSGPNCAQGPLCENHTCKNGGTCVHSSAVSFGCKCAQGFAGSKCEFPLKLACDGKNCNQTECSYDEASEPSCDCDDPQSVPEDRARYEGTIYLLNATQFKNGLKFWEYKNKSFEAYLEKALSKYLRSSNLSKIERLKVLNYTYGIEASFHFYGSKRDEELIRGVLRRFVEKEESSLGTKNVTLRRDATLLIESVVVSKKSIRVGQEFSISCIAQGSVYMTFTWLKDEASINESVITRSVSMHLIYLSPGRYQYTLMIDKASPLDEGIYTCHVSDWHVQQCKGVHVSIAGPPEIRLTPMSATVEKGANLDIICIPLNNRPKQEKFGYSWIKNRHLLKMTTGREVWEDLYLSHYNGGINTGSVLEITNIQKSATYTCQAQGIGASSELSVRVEVVNKSVVPLCHAEGKYGVAWQTTAPGMENIADCPFHAGGHAKRECRLTDFNTTQWDVPNFTGCLSSDIESIYNNFTRLTIGYDVTNGSVTLGNLLNTISRRTSFLPGECERVLDILNHVLKYLNASSLFVDLKNSAGPFYNVINLLLSHERCFITDKKIILLQNLVRSKAIVWGSLFVGSPSVFQDMSSLVIEVIKLNTDQIYNFYFPPKHKAHFSWLTDKIAVRVDTSKFDASSEESFTLVVAAYRNLTQFLRTRYLTRFDDGTDQEFEINSRLVTVELGRRRYRVDSVAESFLVDVELDHFVKDYDEEAWRWSCGVTEFASFRSTWDLTSCMGQLINSSVTKCRCTRTGTYAVLLVARNRMVTAVPNESQHFIVLIGCGCCLIQSLLSLCLLLPYWCRRKNCLVFLKMQCCLATACSMSIFIFSVQHSISKAVFPLVTTFLEIFLLVGLSSHLSKLLVVYSEIIHLPNNKHMKGTVVCVVTGLPVLTVLCNFLGHHTTGWNLHSWWIIKGSMVFNVFVTSALLLVILFAFLYVSVLRKLNVLSKKCSDKNKAVFRRIGLLKRGGAIFVTMILMESASIFYINVLDIFSQYFFSSSSALLGFVIMFCYILKSECSFQDKLVKSVKGDDEEDFSSESIISPLRFFTKQGVEVESDAAPPLRSALMKRGCDIGKTGKSLEFSDQLILSETKTMRRDEGGTLETFISSLDGSIDDGMQDKLSLGSSVHNPLSSFKINDSYLGEYVEQDLCFPPPPPPDDESWSYEKGKGLLPKPDVAQCYIREPPAVTAQEIITTRVCVELGVITTHQKNEVTGQEVATPAIVLCSVDVEPCQSRVVEMTEVVADSVCCSGLNNSGSFTLGMTGQEAEGIVSGNAQQQKQNIREERQTKEGSNGEKTESLPLPEGEIERKQPEGVEEGKCKKEGDNMEGMLDRISHDLDYLLNRKSDFAGIKPGKTTCNNTSYKIAEEDEEGTEEKDEGEAEKAEMKKF